MNRRGAEGAVGTGLAGSPTEVASSPAKSLETPSQPAGLPLARSGAMLLHHLTVSSTLLLLALGACGCDPSADDESCTKIEDTTIILLPVDLSNSNDSFIAGHCIDSAAAVDASGRADCFVIAAHQNTGAPTCDASEGLFAVPAEHQGAVDRLRATDQAKAGLWDTFCEMAQLDPAGARGQACRRDESYELDDQSENREIGFCYVDAAATPPVGNPQLLETCPGGEKQAIRFPETLATHVQSLNKSLTIVCANQVCPAQ
jgi:hypothetical protein